MGKCVLLILIVPNSLIFKDTIVNIHPVHTHHYYILYIILVNINTILYYQTMWTGSQYEALFGLCKQLRSSRRLLWHSLSEIAVSGIRNFALAVCVCMNQSSLLIQISK